MPDAMNRVTEACKSFRSGELVCADGFVQKPICRGYYGCLSCGHISDVETPWCQADNLPAHLFTDSGAPRFYPALKSGAPDA